MKMKMTMAKWITLNKTYIDQDVDIETNIENIVCLGKTISPCNKEYLSKI